jgi:hypothetical protein
MAQIPVLLIAKIATSMDKTVSAAITIRWAHRLSTLPMARTPALMATMVKALKAPTNLEEIKPIQCLRGAHPP